MKQSSSQERLYKSERERTICDKMPSDGYCYAALNPHAFQDFMCEQTGNVIDCYTFYSHSIGCIFEPFTYVRLFDRGQHSDENSLDKDEQ